MCSAAVPAVGRRFDLYAFLPEAVRRDFDAAVVRRQVRSGTTLYRQADLGTAMLRIVRGQVGLSRLRADGRELLFHIMGPGECFGFSTLIDGRGLPHTATARNDVELQVLDKAAFAAMRSRHRSFEDALMHSLCRDIRLLSDDLTDATLDSLPCRVAHRLLEIALPRPHDGAVVRLAQVELAAMFGVSRQSVNKVLKQFADEGLVRLSYGAIELHDIQGLEMHSGPCEGRSHGAARIAPVTANPADRDRGGAPH